MHKLESMPGTHIDEACETAVAWVNENKAPCFFNINGIEMYVEEGDDAADLIKYYHLHSQMRHRQYMASDEYKEAQRQAEEEEAKMKAERAELEVIAPFEPTFYNKELWDSAVANNQDGYGKAGIDFARRWARYMEAFLFGGSTVKSCHEKASHLADIEGITGFQYGCARSLLIQTWKYGKELQEATA